MSEKAEIEDTYAEAFKGIYCRVIVTAAYKETVKKVAEDATATPATVIGRTEAGIEKWLEKEETPDGRPGAILQFWGGIQKGLREAIEKFEKELSYRIRQDILVKPFTSVFDANPAPKGSLDMMKRVGHCGDGYEWMEERFGREMIVVPLMVPNFQIERRLGYATGVMGGNFWYLCKTKKAVMKAGKKALKAIEKIEGAVNTFDICSAGSKPDTNFPEIGPTTNHPYCPSLKKQLGSKSKVPEGVKYIPEIVLNAISVDAMKNAMKAGIQSARSVEGVVKISAGNYGGNLGEYKIHLNELF